MRRLLLLVFVLFVALGCARVRVEAPKDPIKMDISMRLDIYQHVQNDIDTIENLVSGQPKAEDKQSSLNLFVSYAYAEEGMSPQVEQAALRRKDRLAELSSWQAKGVIGENKSALVEIRDPQNADSNASQIVSQENADRMVIYQSIAQRNGTSVAEVQKLYAARLQASVPSGTPIQTQEGAWKVK